MLIAQLSYCQVGYPKLIQIDGDSVIVLSIRQCKLLLGQKYKLSMFEALADSLQEQLHVASQLIGTQKKLITSLHSQEVVYKGLIDQHKQVGETYKLHLDKAQRKNRRIRITNYIVIGVAVIGFGGIIGLIIAK